MGVERRGAWCARLIVTGVLAMCPPKMHAQLSSPSDQTFPVGSVTPRAGVRFRPGRLSRSQMRLMNAERQKHVVADSETLLALARELKTAAALPEKDNNPSAEIVRKLEQIEKLAQQVKKNERE